MKVEKLSKDVTLFFTDDGKIEMATPYNDGFIAAIKSIGGRWNAGEKRWAVPAELEERARVILEEAYGTPLKGGMKKLKISFDPADFLALNYEDIKIGTKTICWRTRRDCPVSFAEGAYLKEGSFPESGGSRNHPAITSDKMEAGELEVVAFLPESTYDKLEDDEKAKITILEEIEENLEEETLESLKAQKEELLKQLKDLDAKIADMEEN